MTTTVPSDVAELTETMAYTDSAISAAASVQQALGLSTLLAGRTRAPAIREDSNHFFNRAGGCGTDRPITVDDLTQVCDFYREEGVARGSLMIAPPLLPPDWDTTASKLGLTEGSRSTKLGRTNQTAPTTGLPILDPGWRVGIVDVQQTPRVGRRHDDHLRVHRTGHDRVGRIIRGQGGLAAVHGLGR
ncbi:hypothetical protein [Streptomyces cellulosae]|uniref:Uncharacterized protein n=1 Tax=Streptomyces cellulosae TaxID=1968 RepID=A0ABW7YHB8_STRCE